MNMKDRHSKHVVDNSFISEYEQWATPKTLWGFKNPENKTVGWIKKKKKTAAHTVDPDH